MANPYESGHLADPFAERSSNESKEQTTARSQLVEASQNEQQQKSPMTNHSNFDHPMLKTTATEDQTSEEFKSNTFSQPIKREETAIDPATSVASNFYDTPADGKVMNNKAMPENGMTENITSDQLYSNNEVNSSVDNEDGVGLTTSLSRRTSKFWTLEFYQQFFNITTRQVLLRLSNTLIPINPPDFLIDRNWHWNETIEQDVRSVGDTNLQTVPLEEAGVLLSRDPDLYGPFWICTTLWMTLGIVSNIMSRIAYDRSSSHNSKWKYDFSVASVACTVMYLYCFVFGSAVWAVMKWKNLPATLIDTVCLYGYSMFIFELVAILCVIPISLLQWLVVIIGGVWSTAYLVLNFWHMWQTTLERQWFIGLVAFVVVFHMALTLSFKFYFLHYKYERKERE